jgi:hypothetical protein
MVTYTLLMDKKHNTYSNYIFSIKKITTLQFAKIDI